MKLDKRSVQPIENGNHKRMTKYRRLKNLLKKSMEISLQCNIMINVSVYDLKSHKLQENFTHKGVALDKIQEMRTTQSTIGSGKKAKKNGMKKTPKLAKKPKKAKKTKKRPKKNDSDDEDEATKKPSKV